MEKSDETVVMFANSVTRGLPAEPNGHRSSVSIRLTHALLKAVLISLLVCVVGTVGYRAVQLETASKARIGYIEEVTRSALPLPLWNLDNVAVDTIMAAFFRDPNLRYMAVVDADGEVAHVQTRLGDYDGEDGARRAPLQGLSRNGNVSGAGDEGALARYSKSWLHLTTVVDLQYDGLKIGRVEIILSRRGLVEQFLLGIGEILILGTVLAAVLVLVIVRESRKVSGVFTRLTELERTATRMAAGDLRVAIGVYDEDEIGRLARSFRVMRDSIKTLIRDLRAANAQLEEQNLSLEGIVAERTSDLEAKNQALDHSLHQVEEANRNTLDSLKYAEQIQRSQLPDIERMRFMPESFCIWQPKDVVGGDGYFVQRLESGFLFALWDCTGHGVPGALMTTMVSTSFQRTVRDLERVPDPAAVLRAVSLSVRSGFHRNREETTSDDGLDAAVCVVDYRERCLTFAGARLDLLVLNEDDIQVFKGDRESLGYRRSDTEYPFTNYQVDTDSPRTLVFSTDGYVDQPGGANSFPFGKRRFRHLLFERRAVSLREQQQMLKAEWDAYKGDRGQVDDVTVIGMRLDPKSLAQSLWRFG